MKCDFSLNAQEVKNFESFEDEMLLKYRCEGSYEFRFRPTGVAYNITVIRIETGDQKCISDFDSW